MPRSAGDARRLDGAERLYRRLLLILPTSFRRTAEAEMVAMFRAGYRRRQQAAWPVRSVFWCRMTADLLATAVAERVPGRHRGESAGAGSAPRAVDAAAALPLAARRRHWHRGRGGGMRHAARRLARAPGRTAMTASTLGIGIGAAIIMLTLVQDVMLRPLPFAHPDDLVRVLEVDDGGRTWWPSFPNFDDWRAHGDAFSGIAAIESPRALPVIFGERASRLPVGRVSPGFFDVLGVPLARGRALAGDPAVGAGAGAVVSWAFWQDQMGGRPLDELSITVGVERFDVSGVTEPGFRFLGAAGAWSAADVWLPLDVDSAFAGRQSHGYHVVGRIAAGLDLAAAQQRMNDLVRRLAAEHGEPTHAHTVLLTPLQEVVVGDARQPLTMLTGGAFLVLVVAAFNLAGALLAAGIARRDELGVRRALGATRGDLARHLLSEALLLGFPGTLVGLAIAWVGLRLLLLAGPATLARVSGVGLDGGTVALALAVGLAAATAGGLAPAWTLSLVDSGKVGGGGRTTSASRRENRWWHLFVAAQVALTMVLLTAGALLLKSFDEARHVDLGYDAGPVLAVAVSLPESRYVEAQRRVAFFDRALAEIGALPGVAAVGVSNFLPNDTQTLIGGAARPSDTETWMFVGLRAINDGYFDALGIPHLGSVEAAVSSEGAIVDQSVAEVLFDGASPVGETLRSSMFEEPVVVSGVVGAVREWNHPMHALGTLYVDYRQQPERLLDAYLLVRTSVPPSSLATPVRTALAGIDPVVPVQIDALQSLVAGQLAGRRLVLGIAAAFALVTLSLAAVGVYSVVAFVMRRRQREMGIRIALGARPAQVRRAMLRHGLRPALGGLVVGAATAAPAGWLLQSQLFGVQPYDPTAIVGSLIVLSTIAALAAYLPTRSAGRQDPVVTLRQQ